MSPEERIQNALRTLGNAVCCSEPEKKNWWIGRAIGYLAKDEQIH